MKDKKIDKRGKKPKTILFQENLKHLNSKFQTYSTETLTSKLPNKKFHKFPTMD